MIHITYLILGLFMVLFGLVSLVIKNKLYLSEPFVASLFGVLIGPSCINLFDPLLTFGSGLNEFTLEFSRLVIGVQVLAAGIQSPGSFVYREKFSMFVLLFPNMLLMWLTSALIIYYTMHLSISDSFLIGACITPTDPVLANLILKGVFADDHIPVELRHLLSAESAANDGLALPLFLLPIFLARYQNVGLGVVWWILNAFLYQIVFASILGFIIGVVARELLKFSQRMGWTDRETLLGFSISLAIFIIGLYVSLGLDEILGCFVVGLGISWDEWLNAEIEKSLIQEVIDSLLNILYFVYFGTLVNWRIIMSLNEVSQLNLFLGIAMIIIFRRLPAILFLHGLKGLPVIGSWKEAIFAGWFGPIGSSAVYYGQLALVNFDYPAEPITSIISLAVISSIMFHGGSVGLFEIGLTTRKRMRGRSADDGTVDEETQVDNSTNPAVNHEVTVDAGNNSPPSGC